MNEDGNRDSNENAESTLEAPGNTDECTVCRQPFTGKQLARPSNCSKNTCILCRDCLKRICKNNLKRRQPCTCPFDRKPFDEILILGKKKGEILKRIPVEELLLEKDNPTYCKICNGCHKQETIVVCFWCDYGFHMKCVDPPMSYFPVGDWSCPPCTLQSGTPSPSTDYEFPTTTRRGLPVPFTLFENRNALTPSSVEQEGIVQETPRQDDRAAASSESSSNNGDVMTPIMNSMDDLNSSRRKVPTLTNSSISNPPISEPTGAHNAEKAMVQQKDKMKSVRRQQISDEVKLALEPHYKRGTITKDNYKQIMKKSVVKIEESGEKRVDRAAVDELVRGYLGILDSHALHSSFVPKSVRHQRHQQIIDEVNLALKPFYKRREITKDDHNQIMKKSFEKIAKSGDRVCRYAIEQLVEQYVFQCLKARRPSGA